MFLDDPLPPVAVSARDGEDDWEVDADQGVLVQEMFRRAIEGYGRATDFVDTLGASPMEAARAVARTCSDGAEAVLRHEGYGGFSLRRLRSETYVDFDRLKEHASFRLSRGPLPAIVPAEHFFAVVKIDGGAPYGDRLVCRSCRVPLSRSGDGRYDHDRCTVGVAAQWPSDLVDNSILRILLDYYLRGTAADRVRSAWGGERELLAHHASIRLAALDGKEAPREARRVLGRFVDGDTSGQAEPWHDRARGEIARSAARGDVGGLRTWVDRLGLECFLGGTASALVFETVCDLLPRRGGQDEEGDDEE